MHAENVRVQAWKILCSHKNSNLCVLTFNKTRTLKGGQNISNLSHGCCTKLNVQLIVIVIGYDLSKGELWINKNDYI